MSEIYSSISWIGITNASASMGTKLRYIEIILFNGTTPIHFINNVFSLRNWKNVFLRKLPSRSPLFLIFMFVELRCSWKLVSSAVLRRSGNPNYLRRSLGQGKGQSSECILSATVWLEAGPATSGLIPTCCDRNSSFLTNFRRRWLALAESWDAKLLTWATIACLPRLHAVPYMYSLTDCESSSMNNKECSTVYDDAVDLLPNKKFPWNFKHKPEYKRMSCKGVIYDSS